VRVQRNGCRDLLVRKVPLFYRAHGLAGFVMMLGATTGFARA
jgi:hypothetical protein